MFLRKLKPLTTQVLLGSSIAANGYLAYNVHKQNLAHYQLNHEINNIKTINKNLIADNAELQEKIKQKDLDFDKSKKANQSSMWKSVKDHASGAAVGIGAVGIAGMVGLIHIINTNWDRG